MPQVNPAPLASPSPTPSPSPSTSPSPLPPTRGLAEEVFDLPGLRHLPFRSVLVVLTELLLLLLIFFVLRAGIRRLVNRTAEALAEREQAIGQGGRAQRIRTLAGLTRSVLTWMLGFIIGVAALSALGLNVVGLIGTAGVAGLAVGFGAQKLVKDVITGFFILLEDQYAVGDYVTINNVTGTIEDLGMRITRLRDDEGKLYILSNGDIGTVCNQSRGPVSGSFEVAIAAAADTGKAAETLNAAFDQLPDSLGLSGAPRVAGISAASAASTTLKVVFRVKPGYRPSDAALQLRTAARDALRASEIPLA